MNKSALARAQLEALQREAARRHLIPFIKRLNPKYQAGWVHEDICRRLERFSKAVAEQKSPRLMLLMPPRHGKQVSDCTPVLTTTGWKKHGDLRPGDKVFHPSGEPVVVLAVAEPLTQDCEVEFTDGAKVLVHENHEWMVYDRSRGRYRVVETKYLERRKLWNGPVGARGGRATFLLPRTHALVMPDAELPVAPYVLGAWLGDGESSSGQICWSANDDVVAQAINAHYPFTSRWTHQTTRVEYAALPITPELRALGLLNNKHIPEQYLLSSIDQRLELLAGLIDTDGHVESDTQRVRVATVSDRLAKDIEILVRSLGWRANRYTQAPATSTSGIVGRQPVHYVSFTPDGPIPTRIPRKRIVGGSTQRSIGIVAVRRVAQTTGRCIQVDSPDGLYLVGEYLTPTHNSEIASRNFPAWHLGQYPDHEFIACSYNLSLAMDFSRKVKGIITDPLYETVFPTRLDPNNQSTESWGIAGHRGGYVAAGIGGPITGKGAHVLVIDDPVKNAEEADSADMRDKIWEWYLSTAYSRLAPGGGVLIIQTWWHDDDLAGRIQNLMRTAGDDDPYVDQFEVIKYPAIAEADEYLNLVTDLIEYDVPNPDPQLYRPLRRKGEALHPDRYDIEKLLRIKAQNKGGRWWSALYQQNPVPDDGGYFTREQFRQGPPPSLKNAHVYIAWDFAITEKKQSDYTVGTVALQDCDDVLHIVDQVRFKSGDAFYIVEAILNLAVKWHNPSLVIGFEDGQIYRAIEALLKKRMRERSFYPSIQLLKPVTDKLARARALQGRMQQGMVSFASGAPWFDSLRTEMLRFPAGAHDDQVDSLAWVAQLAVGKPAPRAPAPPKPKSWKDKLIGEGTLSHMVA